jgi:hypothetical protein
MRRLCDHQQHWQGRHLIVSDLQTAALVDSLESVSLTWLQRLTLCGAVLVDALPQLLAVCPNLTHLRILLAAKVVEV